MTETAAPDPLARLQQLELIANSIPQLAWMADGTGHIFWYNQRWFDYTGTTLAEMDGWGWQSVHDPQELPRVLEKWRGALRAGLPWEDTFPLRRHDGTFRAHLSRASPFQDANGLIQFWFGTNTDIEDQRQQQRELEQTREQLQLSLEAGELGIFHCPLPLGKIVWNQKCKEHFFLPAEADVDFDLFTSLIHPADREKVGEAVARAVEEGAGYDIRYRTVGPNGEFRWLRAKGRTYHDERGVPTRFDGITIDISDEVRQAEEKQALLLAEQSARLEAERANRSKDEFLATLSHELRTPLASVLGWVHILQSEPAQEAEVVEGLAVIERNARVQLRLIEDLLDVSRIISGKLLLELGVVEFNQVIASAIETLEAAARSKQIQVGFQAGEQVLIQGDSSRLQQIVCNLLSNAIKFTPVGGSVTVSLRPYPGFVEMEVADSGVGLKEDFIPHLFDRFRQSDSSTTRRFGGLGLGLALVKQLVELHGGRVRAANRLPLPGASFTVSLPVHGATVEGISERQAIVAPEKVAGLVVVSVDDDDDIRTWLHRLLTNFGVVVHSAASVQEAWDLILRFKPDVVLSDIGMPGEDGYSFLSKLRQKDPQEGGAIPAIALTAFVRPEDREKVRAAGFQEHLSKPVEPSQLLTALAKLTGRM